MVAKRLAGFRVEERGIVRPGHWCLVVNVRGRFVAPIGLAQRVLSQEPGAEGPPATVIASLCGTAPQTVHQQLPCSARGIGAGWFVCRWTKRHETLLAVRAGRSCIPRGSGEVLSYVLYHDYRR